MATSLYTPYFFLIIAEEKIKYGFKELQIGILLEYYFALDICWAMNLTERIRKKLRSLLLMIK